jgi:hypothetical protein
LAFFCAACPLGSSMVNGTTCSPCPIGYFCPSIMSEPQKCGANKTTLTVGASSESMCVCLPGFGGPNCDVCELGTYSAGGTLAPCTPCSQQLQSTNRMGAISEVECQCPGGYGRKIGSSLNDILSCVQCQLGTYGVPDSRDFCRSCPDNTTTLVEGATQFSECLCLPG